MRSTVAFAAGVLTVMTALPSVAQELKPPTNLFGQKAPAEKPPKVDWNWRPSADSVAASKPTVVCGMTLLPADPKVDAKMRVESPERGVAFTMRTVPPAVCKAR
jgi:hypothetical protein